MAVSAAAAAVLVVAALASLTVASADGRAGCCAVSARTVTWSGTEKLTASRIDPDGRTPISYKADFSWEVTLVYDTAGKTFRQTKSSVSVKGTASRFVSGATASTSGPGQPPCSGPVMGLAGPPASSIDSSGNVVFQEAAIPGWPQGEPVGACYGPVITPILPDYSHADVEFKAEAKLSSLLDGTASASDSGGFTNTSTYQGSVCIKGCVAVTAATSGGYVPVGGGKLPPVKPNPTDPVYTNKASLTWNAKVSVSPACGGANRSTQALSNDQPLTGGVCEYKWLGLICVLGVANSPAHGNGPVIYAVKSLTSELPADQIRDDLNSKAEACRNDPDTLYRGAAWRPVLIAVDDPLPKGSETAFPPNVEAKDVGTSTLTGTFGGDNSLLITGLSGFSGSSILNLTTSAKKGSPFTFAIRVKLYRVPPIKTD